MAVEKELDLVQKLRNSLHLVHEDVLMGAARGEDGACQGLGIARETETLSTLLEIHEQICRAPEKLEERRLAGLPSAEDQAGLPPGNRPAQGTEQPP
ncbi:MAG: hypothetical protein A2V74_06010 [Acidobacteria bacterium RBG_16_70_10]|nr:MAG: hypothetical protein A2V74_06010 [Acidobacteria bacterium RBG_16_70_10]